MPGRETSIPTRRRAPAMKAQGRISRLVNQYFKQHMLYIMPFMPGIFSLFLDPAIRKSIAVRKTHFRLAGCFFLEDRGLPSSLSCVELRRTRRRRLVEDNQRWACERPARGRAACPQAAAERLHARFPEISFGKCYKPSASTTPSVESPMHGFPLRTYLSIESSLLLPAGSSFGISPLRLPQKASMISQTIHSPVSPKAHRIISRIGSFIKIERFACTPKLK